MTKQDFQDQQKADFQARYAFLKKEKKMKRPEALHTIAAENNLSWYTVEAIISNHKYRKTLKRKMQ
jgi:hypothetical protein